MSQNFSGLRNILLFLSIALTLVILIYLTLQSGRDQLGTIRIGINQWPGYEFLFVAQQEGFFKEVGLDVELVELSSLTDVRRAFQNGKVDGMASSLIEIVKAFKYSGRIAQIILVTDHSHGANKIVALNEIKSINDLSGKKIGFQKGAISQYLVKRALQLNNLAESDVTWVSFKEHQLPKALTSRIVDAVTTSPPESLTINKLMKVNTIFSSSDIPYEIINVVSIDRNLMTRFPNIQSKLQQAWARTIEFSNNNSEAYTTLTQRLSMSMEEFKESLNSILIVNEMDQSNFLAENGYVQNNLRTIRDFVYKEGPADNLNISDFVFIK